MKCLTVTDTQIADKQMTHSTRLVLFQPTTVQRIVYQQFVY